MSKKKIKRCRAVDTSTTLAARVRSGDSGDQLCNSPQLIQFRSARRSRSDLNEKSPSEDDDSMLSSAGGADFDLSRARHEVFQLGIKGFSRPKRQEAREKKLIKLGARAPPREAKNYKELMAELTETRARQQERRIILRKEGVPSAKAPGPKRKFQKSRDRNKVRGFDGQPGKFKAGVQTVSAKMFK